MRVNEKFPQWLTSGGITSESFTGLVSNLVYPYFYAQDKPVFRYPYEASVFPSVTIGTSAQWLSSLDVMFATRFGERQLRKWVSDLDVHADSTKTVTTDNIKFTNIVAQMINERYGDKWNRMAEALGIDYDPLENYNRTEDKSYGHYDHADNFESTTFGKKLSNNGETLTETVDNLKDINKIKGGWDDTTSDSKTTSGTYSKEVTNAESVAGFNGSAAFDEPAEPSAYSKQTETYTYPAPEESDDFTESSSGSVGRVYKGKTESDDYTEEHEKGGSEYTKHHVNGNQSGWDKITAFGNIGVTTSQQMLESELEVRKNVLFDIILNDIAEMLTISIY